MAPLDNYDRDCWFVDDDTPIIHNHKNNKTGDRIKKFLKTCVESVDNTCIKYCCNGSPVLDDDDAFLKSHKHVLSQIGDTVSLHASADDLEEFASKGGFYDGTFVLEDEDLFDAADMTVIGFNEERVPAVRRVTRDNYDDAASWWSYSSKILTGPKSMSAVELERLPIT